ncbi:MAG: DUF2924 domain-containing protein [Pacificimonas sp.]|jgi:hypothetical protein|nr:DUF2924 domain-containing protein [Pacificimonas sp.]
MAIIHHCSEVGIAADLAAKLREIETAHLEDLRAIWRQHYGPPTKLRSLAFLRLMLAWRLQADAYGTKLDSAAKRQMKRKAPAQPVGRELGLGAKLSREHEGRLIEVVVEEDGFRWDGRLYRSLSAVATAATGTRWNGPRFFGLK